MPDQFKFRGAAMDHLIGQPVVAIVKANQMMATEQVKLLMEICFSKTSDAYEPVMITMSIHRGRIEHGRDNQNASVSETVAHFQVPLITMLPINSLAIENVGIKFKMDVHTHHEVDDEHGNHLFKGISSSSVKSYQLTGNITSHDSRDKVENPEASGGISVNVSTGKLPLPLGVNAIIQAYSKAIHPSDASDNQKDNEK
jgi:Protein of unknown function (DUF2589)